MSDREKRVHATGFSKITDVEGKDFRNEPRFAETLGRQRRKYLCQTRGYGGGALLHYNGRLAQQCHLFHYNGDITGNPEYKAHMMRL